MASPDGLDPEIEGAGDGLRQTNRPDLAPGRRVDRIREARRTEGNIAAADSQVRGRVLIVDDSEAFQHVAASVVSEAPGLLLVGAVGSGEEAIRLLPELKPDLVLLDVHMPGLSGLETAPVIRRESPSTVIVLVSADPGSVTVNLASVGAGAFLSKVELSPRRLEELWQTHVARA